MMHRTLLTPMMTLALLLAVALPAQAQPELPEQAVPEDAVAAVWIDASAFTADSLQAAAERLLQEMPDTQGATPPPEQLKADIEENLAGFRTGRETFLNQGGKGALLILPAPSQQQQGKAPDPITLIQVEPGTNPQDLLQAMKQVAGGEAQDVNLTRATEGWLLAKSAEGEGGDLPAEGSAEAAETFGELLQQAGDGPIKVAFRFTDDFKQSLTTDPAQAGPTAGLNQALQSAEGGYGSLSFGSSPELSTTLNFENEQAAQQFKQAWDGLLMMINNMATAQLSQMPDAPQPQAIQGLFDSLSMQQDGTSLSLALGDEFINRVGDVAPAALGMFMMMQQGGPGGPPPGGPGTQPGPQSPPPGF